MVNTVILALGHTYPVIMETHQILGLWQQDNSRILSASELILPEHSLSGVAFGTKWSVLCSQMKDSNGFSQQDWENTADTSVIIP